MNKLFQCEYRSVYRGDSFLITKVVRASDAGLANSFFVGSLGTQPKGESRIQELRDDGQDGVLVPQGHIYTFSN